MEKTHDLSDLSNLENPRCPPPHNKKMNRTLSPITGELYSEFEVDWPYTFDKNIWKWFNDLFDLSDLEIQDGCPRNQQTSTLFLGNVVCTASDGSVIDSCNSVVYHQIQLKIADGAADSVVDSKLNTAPNWSRPVSLG